MSPTELYRISLSVGSSATAMGAVNNPANQGKANNVLAIALRAKREDRFNMGAKMERIVFGSSFIGCGKKTKQPNALHFSAELFFVERLVILSYGAASAPETRLRQNHGG